MPAARDLKTTGEPAPDALGTLTEVLAWHAQRQPERTHLILLDEDGAEHALGYGELLRQAQAVAAGLQAREIGPGDAVALMLPTCLPFFPACWAYCWPARCRCRYTRPRGRRSSRTTCAAMRPSSTTRAPGCWSPAARSNAPAGLLRGLVAGLRGVVLADDLSPAGTGQQLCRLPLPTRAAAVHPGSTGNPKGVTLTHAQLLANIRAMARRQVRRTMSS